MKCKVIKTWPDGPSVGTIFQKQYGQNCFEAKTYPWTFHKDKVQSSSEFFALLESDVYELPDFMILNNSSFLSDCQVLHDRNEHWEDKGLSEKGKNRVNSIIELHGLNKEVFNKFLK